MTDIAPKMCFIFAFEEVSQLSVIALWFREQTHTFVFHLSLMFYSEAVSPAEFCLYAGNLWSRFERCAQNMILREALGLANLQQICFVCCLNTNHTKLYFAFGIEVF